MKKKLKGFYLIISSLFITLVHLPFQFGKSAAAASTPNLPVIESNDAPIFPMPAPRPLATVKSAYDSLQLNLAGLSKQAFDLARKGFDKLVAEGRVVNDSIVSIVDFSLPSTSKRLYILDLRNYKVLFNTFVAHGRNTGREWATNFSNQMSSYKSSPGFYLTAQTYQGNNGYSLKLLGLEKGINDNAFNRAIVMHGADYVSASFANSHGYLGRSEGCPAIPAPLSRPIINTIKNGSCLFIYHPSYEQQSRILAD